MADVTLTESESEGARFAPWLVLLSGHMPDGDKGCTCGSWTYVGHLPRLLADRHDQLVTARVAAALGEVEAALADVYEIEWAQYGRRAGKAAIRIVREVRGEVGG